MKRLFTIVLLLMALMVSRGTSFAVELKPYAFPFIGKWNPTENPVLLDDYGFQDIQNMRRSGKGLKGVKGHTKLTDTIINDTYYKPRAGIHFVKTNPTESHVILQSWDSTESSSGLYQNKSAIPNSGNFETTTLHTDTSGSLIGRFSYAPNGNMAYSNQKETLIWGGDEMKCAGFLIHYPGNTPRDAWDKVVSNDTATYANLAGATTFYLGSNRRINKAKIYIKTANGTAATLGVSQYVLTSTGVTWQAVADLSDGTASGGKSLAQTGVVSWTFNENDRATFIEDTNILAYWYQFCVPSVDAATNIYYVTVGESEFRPVENIWDGTLIPVTRLYYTTGSGTTDFTTEVQEDSQDGYADLETFSTTNSIVVGFSQKMRGLSLYFVSAKINSVISGVSVQYWNGSGWSGVTGLYDGTKSSDGKTFNKNAGYVHWLPTEESTSNNVESQRTYQSNELFYYYRITVSVNLTDDVQLYYAQGIPAQAATGSKKSLTDGWKLPLLFQGRLFLFNNDSEGVNKAIYSPVNAPDVFNGSESSSLTFGDEQPINAGGVIYNVFQTTGYEQLILTKSSEAYRLVGNGPDNWEIQQLSPNVGCVAPGSFVVCEVADVQKDLKRNVVIWQASHGFVLCDAATIQTLPDVGCYFNSADSRAISKHRIDDTVAWYDPGEETYHALISSGAEVKDKWGDGDTWDNAPSNDWGVDWENSITTHNVELEYSLKYNEWSKIARADASGTTRPLQVGFQVKNTDGRIYTYGATDVGNLYRLEYGRTWDGYPIDQYVHTKDLMLDEQKSIFNMTAVKRFRLLFENKAAGSGETIMVTHYGDGVESVSGTSNQVTVRDISMNDTDGRNSQDVNLGQALKHSFKLEANTSTVDEGMELLGMGLWFESFNTWQE